ncbi:MAG: 4-demethylwyosine synthase TYW1 [Halobacteriota archaeon]|nr:4-demethylwyosine synthase TYW1 [Halobacteriota archaeon]
MQNDLNLLISQGHHFVGRHSAVKTCMWLKRSMRDKGNCYKNKFYGINSHRCLQMTPYIGCNHKCIFCWRPLDLNMGDLTEWDDPETIASGCISAQKKLISGYKGAPTTNLDKFYEAIDPKHVAISLIGEPTLYPYLPELISRFHEANMTTFLVTNGTNPKIIEKVEPTQLYLSLGAQDRETYLKVCRPDNDYWDRINKSLQVLSKKECRVAIRITLVDGVNLKDASKYAELLDKADPDFVEVKAYMHLGHSRKRLNRTCMPPHVKVKSFARDIASEIGYKVVSDSEVSRIALISNRSETGLELSECVNSD